jgi:5-methylcytosine-specific restriction endonuclease McrA
MNKLKLSSRAQVFKKYGATLKVPKENEKGFIELDIKNPLKRTNLFKTKPTDHPSLPYELFVYNIRTTSLLDKECAACGSKDNVEMHHRKPLKNKLTDNTFKGISINLARKQIPLCRICHQKVHKGTFDGPGIK